MPGPRDLAADLQLLAAQIGRGHDDSGVAARALRIIVELLTVIMEQQDTIGSQQQSIDRLSQQPAGPRAPTGVRFRFAEKETPMPTKITVDTKNEVVLLDFVDDFNNPTGVPLQPDGVTPAVVAVTSDNPAIVTGGAFAPSATAPETLEAPLVPGGTPGTVNVGVSVQDATGADVLLPTPAADGSTTYTAEAGTQALEVDPGAPVGDRIALGTA